MSATTKGIFPQASIKGIDLVRIGVWCDFHFGGCNLAQDVRCRHLDVKARRLLCNERFPDDIVTHDNGGEHANRLGQWTHDIIGGGSRQRQLAIRLGVNIVMYALTLDYKKDMVHLPIILERLKRHQLP